LWFLKKRAKHEQSPKHGGPDTELKAHCRLSLRTRNSKPIAASPQGHGQLPPANLSGREQGFHDAAAQPRHGQLQPSTQLVVVSSTPSSVYGTADCLWRPFTQSTHLDFP
jgi:hypothetical protein